MALRVVVIEDHALLRGAVVEALVNTAGFQVVAEAGDAAHGVQAVARHQPDIIVLDHHLPGQTGVEALPTLRDAAPRASMVIWTAEPDVAARAGLHGDPRIVVVSKADGLTALVDAILRTISADDD